MSSINEKLGLRPRTSTRKATHASTIVSDARCPKCGGRHVVRTVARNAPGDFMCGSCSHFWKEATT